MKRVCTEQEKTLLYQNRNNICTGFVKNSSHGKWMEELVMAGIWMVVFIGGEIPLIECLKNFEEWMLFSWGVISLSAVRAAVHFVMKRMYIRNEKKHFTRKDQIIINGATVVSVINENKFRSFSFIEDDEYTEDKRPYRIYSQADSKDVKDMKAGDRLIVLYGSENSGGKSFQIMKMNEQLRGLIPEENNIQLSRLDMDSMDCVIHPNEMNLAKEKRLLSKEEKEELKMRIMKERTAVFSKVLKVCGLIVFFCGNIFVLGIMGNCTERELLCRLLLVNAVIAIILFLLKLLSDYTGRFNTDFDYVQEVLFDSFSIGYRAETSTTFYEWDNNEFVRKKYPNIGCKSHFGAVFYKYTSEKGNSFFEPKDNG